MCFSKITDFDLFDATDEIISFVLLIWRVRGCVAYPEEIV